MEMLKIECPRTAYSPSGIGKTMNVGELKELLDQYPDDMPVCTSHDNGYTYGPILEMNIDVIE